MFKSNYDEELMQIS